MARRVPSSDPPIANGGGSGRNAVPLYDVPRRLVRTHRLTTMPLRTSAMRALGAHLNVVAIESVVDDLAAATGADPVDYRLGLLSVWSPRAPVFAESDLELVQLLARQAAAVIESRALLQEVAVDDDRELRRRDRDGGGPGSEDPSFRRRGARRDQPGEARQGGDDALSHDPFLLPSPGPGSSLPCLSRSS